MKKSKNLGGSWKVLQDNLGPICDHLLKVSEEIKPKNYEGGYPPCSNCGANTSSSSFCQSCGIYLGR